MVYLLFVWYGLKARRGEQTRRELGLSYQDT